MTGSSTDRVSIIIPCYNAGDHLVEAVESALAQSHEDLEIVIVDDGSTDERTIRILETSRWPRTRVIRQANAGPSAARNTAISAATGAYILPLDADDRIGPKYVAEALGVLKEHPEVGVVYCRAQKFGAEQGPWMLPAYTLRELVIDNVVFVTAMYRKEDWARIGGYNEALRHGVEDYDFWIRMVSLGREVIQLEACHFYYRVQQQSRTTGFSQDRGAVVRTYADIVRSNAPFFLEHMEFIFEHRFGLYDEIEHYRSRYSDIEVFLRRFPILRKTFDAFLRILVTCLRTLQKVRRLMNKLILVPILGLLGIAGGCREAPNDATQQRQLPAEPVEALAAPIQLDSIENAAWTRQACDLTVADGGKMLLHRTGERTIFEGFLIGPDEKPPGSFQVVLKGPNAAYSLDAATGVSRLDVAAYFDNGALSDSGFRVVSKLAEVPSGTYDINFYMETGGTQYFCESGKSIKID